MANKYIIEGAEIDSVGLKRLAIGRGAQADNAACRAQRGKARLDINPVPEGGHK